MAGSIEKRGKNSYRLVCTGGYDPKWKTNQTYQNNTRKQKRGLSRTC